jgi:hypothetical protein
MPSPNKNASGLTASQRNTAKEIFKIWKPTPYIAGIPGHPTRMYSLGKLYNMNKELIILKGQYGRPYIPHYMPQNIPNRFSNKLETFRTKVLPLFNSARYYPKTGNYISKSERYNANKFNALRKTYNI